MATSEQLQTLRDRIIANGGGDFPKFLYLNQGRLAVGTLPDGGVEIEHFDGSKVSYSGRTELVMEGDRVIGRRYYVSTPDRPVKVDADESMKLVNDFLAQRET